MTEFHPELFDLSMSAEEQPLLDAVKKHIAENVDSISEEFEELHKQKKGPWSDHPRQLELLENARKKAREASVYAVPDARLGEEVGATLYVSEILDEAALRDFLADRLARFEIPRYCHQQTNPLPRIASGKIAKRQLQAAAISRLE